MRAILNCFLLCCLILISGCTTYHRYRHFSPLAQARALNDAALRAEMASNGLTLGAPIFIRAFKAEMELEVWALSKYTGRYKLFKTYPICKKSGKLGPKQSEGDLQTPEGFYFTSPGRMNPNSKYYLSFDIGYPNDLDRSLGRTGSALMIHGDCVSEGCLAMNDKNIGEIYVLLDESFAKGNNTVPIHIFPFRMQEQEMQLRAGSVWMPFWQNLKQGYDYFEKYNIPSPYYVENGMYVFGIDEKGL